MKEDHIVWRPARTLPTPRIPLMLRLDSGDIVNGSRPSYIQSYDEEDLGYRDQEGNILMNVTEWAIA